MQYVCQHIPLKYIYLYIYIYFLLNYFCPFYEAVDFLPSNCNLQIQGATVPLFPQTPRQRAFTSFRSRPLSLNITGKENKGMLASDTILSGKRTREHLPSTSRSTTCRWRELSSLGHQVSKNKHVWKVILREQPYYPIVGTTSSKGATGFEASSWQFREESPRCFCHIFRCISHLFQLKLQLLLIHISS